jgi:hypothetical protein
MTTFKDYPVLLKHPNWATEPKMFVAKPYELFGDLNAYRHKSYALESSIGYEFEFLAATKAEIWEMWQFLDALRGRLNPFWIPSWHRDVVITAPFSAADTTIQIEDIEYADCWGTNSFVGRYLYIEWPDGSYVISEVEGAPGSTSLQLASGIGKDGPIPSQLLVSFLLYVRLDLDNVRAQYATADVAVFALPVVTLLPWVTGTGAGTGVWPPWPWPAAGGSPTLMARYVTVSPNLHAGQYRARVSAYDLIEKVSGLNPTSYSVSRNGGANWVSNADPRAAYVELTAADVTLTVPIEVRVTDGTNSAWVQSSAVVNDPDNLTNQEGG